MSEKEFLGSYKDAAKLIIDRMDLKYTKKQFEQHDEDNTSLYKFHVDLTAVQNVDKLITPYIEDYVIEELRLRGFQNSLVEVAAIEEKKITATTFFKKGWHKHDDVTCPTYFICLAPFILDIPVFFVSGLCSTIKYVSNVGKLHFTHQIAIQLQNQQ